MSTDNEDFGSMLAAFEAEQKKPPRKDPKEGDIVRGTILSIGKEVAFVDLGAKSDAMIELEGLKDAEGKLPFQVGDELEAQVVETASGKSGCIVLRQTIGRGGHAAISADVLSDLASAHAHGFPVEGLVTGLNKGGLEVQVSSARAFCPLSQLDLRHVDDPSTFVGQRYTFRITRFEVGGRGGAANLVLSRRALLEEEAEKRAEETRGLLKVGAVVHGRVTALKDYGAFVDVGGLEGMLHVSQLGFSRVGHPKELLSVGQELDVQILKIEKGDDGRERISLSLKSLERDPWADAKTRFPEGARLSGKVMRLEPFGAFVEIAPGVEALLHLDELKTDKQIRHPKEVLKIGQPIDVTVLSLDEERRRIGLRLAGETDTSAGTMSNSSTKLGTFADLLKKKR